MNIQDFIDKLVEALEIEDASAVTGETVFRNLDEWSSLSVMLLIAMFDEEYGKEITDKDIKACTTVAELYKLCLE